MKLLNKLTLKNLRLNKVRTIVTIVGIMLSAALITVVSGMALSGRQTMIDAQMVYGGNYDVALDIIDNSVIETARNNRNVENAFYKERLGYARTKNADGEICDYSVLAMSENTYGNCFKIDLIKGKFPTNSGEAVVTKAFKTQDGKDVKIGDKITLDVGVLTDKDGNVLDEEGIHNLLQKVFNKCSIIDTVKRTYTVTGIIERPKTSELYDPSNLSMIYTVSDEKGTYRGNQNKAYE